MTDRSTRDDADIPEARTLAECRARLGDDHLDTLTAMLDLAEMLWPRGRLTRSWVSLNA